MSDQPTQVSNGTQPSTSTVSIDQTRVAKRTLGTWQIIVLIIGAMTPLAVIVGTAPLGFAFGGPSTVLAFLIAGIVIGIFCIGYVQMVRRIDRPGAFYNYIARGLGRPAGVGGAMVGTIGYLFGFLGAAAIQGFTLQESIIALTGVEVPWVLLHVIPLLLVGFLIYRRIDISAMLISIIVAFEVVLLLALSFAIIARDGIANALPLEVISPDVFSIGSWTVAFIFAFLCFQGYEAGALYAPEAKNPGKTVPRALYGALAIIVVVLVLTTWTLTSVSGIETQMDVVLEQGLSGFIFATVGEYLGTFGLVLFSIGSLLAQLAVMITIGNFMSRYLNGLARDSILPSYLGRLNKHGAPYAAQFTLIGIGIFVPLLVWAFGGDPYTQVSTIAFGVGAIAATLLQALASISVVGYFLKQPAAQRSLWKQIIIPSIASVLLIAALAIELAGFSWITGVEAGWTVLLPILVFAMLVFGIGFGYWLRKNRPEVYQDLAAGDSAEEAAAIRTDRLMTQAAAREQKKQ
ncbi:APC family permease [Gulosibacter molinativorax]|nr:APC family permease [Gulosibacter molinativorax]QUY63452.1 Hypotetical protein [Gulosibacter molinativorax]